MNDEWDGILEEYRELDEPDQEELREYFNSVIAEDNLGTFIFDKENLLEDIVAKLNALDDGDKEKFASAVEESRLISIPSTAESENPE